jgi:hypothetical protein
LLRRPDALNRIAMAKKPTKHAEFALFDVLYQDGTLRSNRRVPREVLASVDGEAAVRAVIAEQDREIAEKSGLAPVPIKNIRPAGAKKWPGEMARKLRKGTGKS